ncbi:putative intracellular septation protein [Buchnera aphidicola str. Bp (Baizongia pistaciae)]|uniref:Membrane-spanning protein YciB n=1 Tax=Buchnera aphidicola subsp. Baizongia pistaciae (strain Bp) TaxID=224915 RepID=YCIB_BUCBP|nr:inner membrane-spanning protein YciB [Buchnera aphidicola]Q89AL3.1 RecName: Full=Membrane-spanning protein YciB [Buchnera aphidicola str. Bp (Baizongia pistaciae)]AAO26982.1 putative intracellular septation protein [Buchnera aphidicola str. Bp (Baizongia pistaciae)]
MKFLLNSIPTISFFIFYKFYDIFIASFSLMIASLFTFIITSILFNSINKHDLINLIFVIVFGFLTLFYHNSSYIKWKVTIIYFLISIVFLINYLFIKNNLLNIIFKNTIQLSKNVWRKLSLFWSIFFLICAVSNTYIILYFSEQTWVTFKIFGLTILTLIAVIINGFYIYFLKSKIIQ